MYVAPDLTEGQPQQEQKDWLTTPMEAIPERVGLTPVESGNL